MRLIFILGLLSFLSINCLAQKRINKLTNFITIIPYYGYSRQHVTISNSKTSEIIETSETNPNTAVLFVSDDELQYISKFCFIKMQDMICSSVKCDKEKFLCGSFEVYFHTDNPYFTLSVPGLSAPESFLRSFRNEINSQNSQLSSKVRVDLTKIIDERLERFED